MIKRKNKIKINLTKIGSNEQVGGEDYAGQLPISSLVVECKKIGLMLIDRK